jgi:anti-sigma-K factor RskA
MSFPVDEQRDWLALQYVLGELSDADREAFEERLGDDLAACDAVAAASRLVLALRAAAPVPEVSPIEPAVATDSRHPKKSAFSAWLSVVVASAAMAVLCLFATRTPVSRPTSSDVVSVDHTAVELVSLWRSGMDADEGDVDDMDEGLESSSEDAVPGWMLAAVSLETPGIDGTSEKVQEN